MNITFLSPSSDRAITAEGFSCSYSDMGAYVKAARLACPESTRHAAIFSENRPEWAFALMGIWSAGAAAVPVDAQNNAEELAFILEDSDADCVFVSEKNLEVCSRALEKLKNPPKLLILEKIFSSVSLASGESDGNWKVERESSELALIVYTSGTTGNPKGVLLSFKNLHANVEAVEEAGYYYRGMRTLCMLPFHHILPLMGTLIGPLFVKGEMVIPKSIAPGDIASILSVRGVDMIIGVPRFYELLHANIMGKISSNLPAKILFGLSQVVGSVGFARFIFGAIHKKFGGRTRFWISGGAPLDKKIWRDLRSLGFSICEGYGMSECAPIITFPRIGNIKVGSAGQALPGVEIRIVDGEIVVRGGNVTSGYYKRPEETAETIRNGWIYTGDLGYMDEDGFLFITGRRKEIIVLPNGKNVDPSEIESGIRERCPDEIAEIGVLSYQNILQAIIRVDEKVSGKYSTREELESHVRDVAILPYNRAAATYKRVIRFTLTDTELPRTRVGKIKRFHLAAYLENIGNDKPKLPPRPEPDTRVYLQLKEFLASQVSMPVDPDSHMEMDLGLDSLGKISMQCFVRENYGVEISEREFSERPTLREMSEYIDARRDSEMDSFRKNISWADIIKRQPFPGIPKTNFFHFLTIMFFKAILKLCYKLEVRGLENLPPTGAVIVAPNHQSYMDGAFVAGAFTKTQIYKTFFFAKTRGIIKKGFLRSFARHSNVIIMDILDNVGESIRKLAAALQKGNRVVVFPEGTRTRDGFVAEFKPTFSILSKEMEVPVCPVAISGAYEALKPGAIFPSFGSKIRVSFLPLMLPDSDESYEDFSDRVREAVVAEVASLKKDK